MNATLTQFYVKVLLLMLGMIIFTLQESQPRVPGIKSQGTKKQEEYLRRGYIYLHLAIHKCGCPSLNLVSLNTISGLRSFFSLLSYLGFSLRQCCPRSHHKQVFHCGKLPLGGKENLLLGCKCVRPCVTSCHRSRKVSIIADSEEIIQ